MPVNYDHDNVSQPIKASFQEATEKLSKWADDQRAKWRDLVDMDVMVVETDLTHYVISTKLQLSQILDKAETGADGESTVKVLGGILHDPARKKHVLFKDKTLVFGSVDWELVAAELNQGYVRVVEDAKRQAETFNKLLDFGKELLKLVKI